MWQYPEVETFEKARAKRKAKQAAHKMRMTCQKNKKKRR